MKSVPRAMTRGTAFLHSSFAFFCFFASFSFFCFFSYSLIFMEAFMFNFLLFAVKRYSRFCSYIAAFLAGLSFSLQGALFWCPLAVSIVLGSLAAYEGSSSSSSSGRSRSQSRSFPGSSSISSSDSVPEHDS